MGLALLLLAVSALAADLTLAEAIDAALSAHPTGEVADARLDQAQATRASAAAALLPSATVTGTYTRRPQEVTVGDDEAVLQAKDALRAQVTASVPVLDLSALRALDAAAAGVDAQEVESDEIRRALAFRVADAYVAVLAAERLVAAAERREALADDLAAAARARLEAGLGTRSDITRTELERATAALVGVRARGERDVARVRLSSLVGRHPGDELTEPELEIPEATLPHPAVTAAELRALQARREASAALWGYLPTLGAFATASATNEAGFSGRQRDWGAGGQATWSAFDGGRRLATGARARARARELDARADELALDAAEARALAETDLATADAALAVARVRAELAAQSADEQRERFALGAASALEVSDAAATAFEAEASLAGHRLARHLAALALGDARGAWPQELLR